MYRHLIHGSLKSDNINRLDNINWLDNINRDHINRLLLYMSMRPPTWSLISSTKVKSLLIRSEPRLLLFDFLDVWPFAEKASMIRVELLLFETTVNSFKKIGWKIMKNGFDIFWMETVHLLNDTYCSIFKS